MFLYSPSKMWSKRGEKILKVYKQGFGEFLEYLSEYTEEENEGEKYENRTIRNDIKINRDKQGRKH